MKKNTSTFDSEVRIMRRGIVRIFLAISTLVLILSVTLSLLKVVGKVCATQVDLAFIAFEIDDYNALQVKTDAATEKITKTFAKRTALENSTDPVIAWSAKDGASVLKFCLGALCFLAVLAAFRALVHPKVWMAIVKWEYKYIPKIIMYIVNTPFAILYYGLLLICDFKDYLEEKKSKAAKAKSEAEENHAREEITISCIGPNKRRYTQQRKPA